MTVELYPYQRVGVEWLKALPKAGILADDMGTGKTIQSLSAAFEVGARRILIVTTKSALRVWRKELEKVAPEMTSYKIINADVMSPPDRIAAIKNKSIRVIMINYEMMLKHIATLNTLFWDVVIFDEAHKLKNRHSQTYKASRTLVRKANAERAWFLTGTPVSNHTEDYWPLLRICDTQFGSYWNYVAEYCDVVPIYRRCVRCKHDGHAIAKCSTCDPQCYAIPQEFGKEVRNITDENDPRVKKLLSRISKFVLRRTKEQVFPDMPPKLYQRIPVPLDPETRRLKEAFDSKMKATLPSGDEIRIDTEMSLTTRQLQLTVDWKLMLGEDCRSLVLGGPKVDALLNKIDELQGEPFVLFSPWSRAVDMTVNLLKKQKIAVSVFTGENTETRDKELEKWELGQTQGLIATIGAGGVGLDFTRASTVFFLGRSWNPKEDEQAEDRLHRHGQKQTVNVYDFYVEGTIEEYQFQRLDEKTLVANNIVEALV